MEWFSLPALIVGVVIQLFSAARVGPAKPSGLQPMAYICETADTGITHGDDGRLDCGWRFVK
jgi:hypothetical protein